MRRAKRNEMGMKEAKKEKVKKEVINRKRIK